MRSVVNIVCISLVLTALGLAACGTTPGVPITVDLRIEGLGDGDFRTFSGWQVELSEARALVGPLYAYAPLDDADERMTRALFSVPVAHAHGGLDPLDGRVVRFEHLDAVAVDLLGEPTLVAQLPAFEGALDTLTVGLDEAHGDLASPDGPTRGFTLFVRGIARRGEAEVPFEGGLDLGEVEVDRRVDGIPIEGDGPLLEGTTLVVGLDPDAWLGEASFEDAAFTPESQAYRAWRLGARSAVSWSARVEGL